MNVLFVGNSYTYYNDMPAIFQQLARDNNKDVTATSVTKGGRKLISYKDPFDATTVKLTEALQQHYDVCVIQEHSVQPITEFDAFREGLTLVANMAKPHTDKFILYCTWCRKHGHKVLVEQGWNTEGMTEMLVQSYKKAAAELGAEIAPVGKNFLAASRLLPEVDLYDPDLTHPSYAGSVLSALTHYQVIFGEFPKKTASLNLEQEVIDAFRAVVSAGL